MVDKNETEVGGFKEIALMITGDKVYSKLKFENGAHRVQRVPVTESAGRVHTSAATVGVMPEAEDVDVELDPRTSGLMSTVPAVPVVSTLTRPLQQCG